MEEYELAMIHRTWMLTGGMIGILGFALGIGVVGAGPWPHSGALLIPVGIVVALGSQIVAFRFYGDYRAGARRRT